MCLNGYVLYEKTMTTTTSKIRSCIERIWKKKKLIVMIKSQDCEESTNSNTEVSGRSRWIVLSSQRYDWFQLTLILNLNVLPAKCITSYSKLSSFTFLLFKWNYYPLLSLSPLHILNYHPLQFFYLNGTIILCCH